MTIAKATALGACLAGVTVLGVWMSPYVRDRANDARSSAVAPVETAAPSAAVTEPAAIPAETTPAPTAAPAKAVAKPAAVTRPAPRKAAGGVMGFSPDLHKRLKSVLNQGADLSVASDGFRSPEQFATVAHASRNTEVPFMVLKHRVLSEGMTLPAAILASKPDVNAAAEVTRAKEEAKVDLAAAESQLASNRH